MSKQEGELALRKNALKGTMTWPNERVSFAERTLLTRKMSTCAYCGNALPRCVVCMSGPSARIAITDCLQAYNWWKQVSDGNMHRMTQMSILIR
jgi:hypothetical protein